VPTHFSPSVSIPITTSIDITDSVRNTHTLPRDSKMWNDTSRIRKTPLTKILNKLKSFPILTSLNSAKDFMYLAKVTKFPFIGIKSPWEGPVISHIVKQGAVGIACSRQEEHNYLRKFWNTYGLAVLEDITFQQPHPAHTLDFIEMLANKKYMTVSKRTNVDWKPDFDGDA
jgi:hypothetical protein